MLPVKNVILPVKNCYFTGKKTDYLPVKNMLWFFLPFITGKKAAGITTQE